VRVPEAPLEQRIELERSGCLRRVGEREPVHFGPVPSGTKNMLRLRCRSSRPG
jgi:hypothetical protein